jgi:hypothetical protein
MLLPQAAHGVGGLPVGRGRTGDGEWIFTLDCPAGPYNYYQVYLIQNLGRCLVLYLYIFLCTPCPDISSIFNSNLGPIPCIITAHIHFCTLLRNPNFRSANIPTSSPETCIIASPNQQQSSHTASSTEYVRASCVLMTSIPTQGKPLPLDIMLGGILAQGFHVDVCSWTVMNRLGSTFSHDASVWIQTRLSGTGLS